MLFNINFVSMKRLVLFLTFCSLGFAKPSVTTTLAPHAYALEAIVKDRVDVQVLIPENANPHIHESKPQDIKMLSQSTLWFCIGESIEKKLGHNVNAKKIDLNQGLETLSQCCHHDHHHHHAHDHNFDTHTWLSPKNYRQQAKQIFEALCNAFPEHKSFFETNYQALDKELEGLVSKVDSAKNKNSTLIVAHAAYAYLCKDLRIEQVSLEHDGKEANLRHIQKIYTRFQNKAPQKIFAETQHSDAGAKRLSDLLKARVVYVNPYQRNYPQSIHEIIDSLP